MALRAQAPRIAEDRDEFRVEAHIDAVGVIVELEIGQQGYVGKHILDEQRFAPAAVADDQVGPKALLA